jgi:hypothetical protein
MRAVSLRGDRFASSLSSLGVLALLRVVIIDRNRHCSSLRGYVLSRLGALGMKRRGDTIPRTSQRHVEVMLALRYPQVSITSYAVSWLDSIRFYSRGALHSTLQKHTRDILPLPLTRKQNATPFFSDLRDIMVLLPSRSFQPRVLDFETTNIH